MPGENTIIAPATVDTTPTYDIQAVETTTPEVVENADIQTGAEAAGGEGGEGSENGSDVKDALKGAADQALQKFEFIVDGKTVTEEYTPAQVKQLLQKAKGADKRFQSAAKLERMNQELLWLAKNDPAKLLSHGAVGIDPYKWAEQLLYDKIKLEQMDPKDRELMETQNKLKASEERSQESQRQQQAEQVQRAVNYARENNQREIGSALKENGMPVNNYTLRRTAHYMLEAMNMNVKVTAAEVLPLVVEDYKAEQSALFDQSDPEALASLLGESNLKKLRGYELKRIKVKPKANGDRKNNSLRDVTPGPKKMSMDDFRAYNEKQKRGEI